MFEKLKNLINKMKNMIISLIKSTCVKVHEEKKDCDIKSLCMRCIITLWVQTIIKSCLKSEERKSNNTSPFSGHEIEKELS